MSQVQVQVIEGRNLTNKEMFGKQDPFLRLGFDFTNQMQQTMTHKNGGREPRWNQTFELVSTGPELYIEAYDEDPTTNDLIGIAAIPMQQVFQAGPNGFNAWFRIYNTKGKEQGEIHLVFTPPQAMCRAPEVMGSSFLNEQHKKAVSSKETKKTMAEVGMGAAVAGGVALVGGLLFNEHKKHEQQDRIQQEEIQQEKNEIQRLEQEKYQLEQQQQQQQQYGGGQYGGGQYGGGQLEGGQFQGEGHHHHPHHHHHHGGGQGGFVEWDPIGTYIPGQQVQYMGRTWECLQGHTSNPTWQPGAATSLWRVL